ncbi:alpha/beta hydrolase [Luteipulveratus sp. YIM 133132]|uniref:alpha/beta hydrolase n=1 Tax=Luteipulveratus flavus TaxID=3031728 RepID=UPI0023B15AAB|nr:alpha/beta hydrolase [Luteipulveratus sp. YIM 133132]MDE9364651.1 alpha/beta hydrolase [Luteipulveratus sp. YIM 133132]
MLQDTRPLHLRLPRVRRPRAVALVLHGGQEHSEKPVSPRDLALVRMLPFARDLELRSHGRVGAALLRNSVRGWNGDARSPVADAERAIADLRRSYPDLPIGLIGHSLGGRVALELAGHPDVSSIVALAPWVGGSYPAERFVGTPLLVVHGRRDIVTDPKLSEALVERIRARGGDATFIGLAGGHTMLRRASTWHRLASRFTQDRLLGVST